ERHDGSISLKSIYTFPYLGSISIH
ncbi:unnamed protein product, partial [Linum tenue]